MEKYPWQEEQFQTLKSLHAQSKLPHACLFTGLPGVGKFQFAKYFAAFLLCENINESGICHECKSCLLFAGGTHPDVMLLEPLDGASVIKVDQVRELVDFVNKTAQRAGHRVILIDQAEKMNVAAANALLKSLEEPGKDTTLLLVSSSPDALLPTIRSRCQRYIFPVPDKEIVMPWLVSIVADQSRALSLLKEANGAPLLALSNFDNDLYQNRGILA